MIAAAQAAIAMSEVKVTKTAPRIFIGGAVSGPGPVINSSEAAPAVNAQGNTKSLAFLRISIDVSSTSFPA
jgi:hypothetical protein